MTEDKKQKLKVIGGGLIIACAFAIMMPGLVSYLFGLWRIIVLIVTIIVVTVILVFLYHRFLKKPIAKEDQPSSNDSNPEKANEN